MATVYAYGHFADIETLPYDMILIVIGGDQTHHPLMSCLECSMNTFFLASYIKKRVGGIGVLVSIIAGQSIHDILIGNILIIWSIGVLHIHAILFGCFCSGIFLSALLSDNQGEY